MTRHIPIIDRTPEESTKKLGQQALPDQIESRINTTKWAIWWEKTWYGSWPFLMCFVAVASILFSGLLPTMPEGMHQSVLVFIVFALLASIIYWFKSPRNPKAHEIYQRLETENNLKSKPITQLHDDLLAGADNPVSQKLWEAHRNQLIAQLTSLKAARPKPGLFRRDPFGLRVLGIITLLLTIFLPAGTPLQRLQASLMLENEETPNAPGLGLTTPLLLDVWISPPAYTGISPIFLVTGDKQTNIPIKTSDKVIEIPEGSVLHIGISGGTNLPPTAMAGDIPINFQEVGLGSFQGKGLLLVGNKISLFQGNSLLGSWNIRLIPDRPPVISFTKQPTGTGRGRLDISYTASDDHHIQSIKAFITLLNDKENTDNPDILEVTLPVISKNNNKIVQGSKLYDSAAHRWAGLPVRVQLIANDGSGQFGRSKAVEILLPQRRFRHPLAQAVIIQRRLLNITHNRETRLPVVMTLHHIANQPLNYREDTLVTLGLRTSLERLLHDQTETALGEVQDILWKVALRIEDGDLSQAEQQLRTAQQNLQEALNNGASDQELQQRMQELREAMENYMSSMQQQFQQQQQQAQQDGQQQGEAQSDGQGQFENQGNGQPLSSEDLQRMLDQAENLARSGARDAAQDLLSELEELMDNLTMVPNNGGQGDSQTGQNRRPQDQLPSPDTQLNQGLNQLMQEQQELMDRQFGQSQGNNRPNQNQENAQQQGQLRQELGEQMRQMGELLGEIPQEFGAAERAMREAEEALKLGNNERAGEAMARALEEMQDGSRQLQDKLAQRRAQNGDRGLNQEHVGRDPLGRTDPGQGRMDEGNVKIPDINDMQKSRNILEELRRRAGDPNRSAAEREYLDRLLKLF